MKPDEVFIGNDDVSVTSSLYGTDISVFSNFTEEEIEDEPEEVTESWRVMADAFRTDNETKGAFEAHEREFDTMRAVMYFLMMNYTVKDGVVIADKVSTLDRTEVMMMNYAIPTSHTEAEESDVNKN